MKRPRVSMPTRSQIAKFMGPTKGAPGSCRPQMGPILAPWTLLSGVLLMGHVSHYLGYILELYHQYPSHRVLIELQAHNLQFAGTDSLIATPVNIPETAGFDILTLWVIWTLWRKQHCAWYNNFEFYVLKECCKQVQNGESVNLNLNVWCLVT